MAHLKKYDSIWLREYLKNSAFDADLICNRLDREYEYSKVLLKMIILEADKYMATKSVACGLTLEALRQVYNQVNGLTFEQGLEVEKEIRIKGFKE